MNAHNLFYRALMLTGLAGGILAATPPKIEDLAAWSVTGVDQDQLVQDLGVLNLIANAQLFRTVAGDEITVQMESSPVFGLAAGDLPVLELGDAAVAFLRIGETGKLVLVLGHNPALTIPFAIPLGADGRSAEPLPLTLSRQGATVALSLRGQTWQFPGGFSARPQEIVLSAGASQSWPIQALSVTAQTHAIQPGEIDSSGNEPSMASRAAQARGQTIESQVQAAAIATTGESSVNAASTVTESTVPARTVTLEIFTPPSVRHGRAHAVRAATIEAAQKYPGGTCHEKTPPDICLPSPHSSHAVCGHPYSLYRGS